MMPVTARHYAFANLELGHYLEIQMILIKLTHWSPEIMYELELLMTKKQKGKELAAIKSNFYVKQKLGYDLDLQGQFGAPCNQYIIGK